MTRFLKNCGTGGNVTTWRTGPSFFARIVPDQGGDGLTIQRRLNAKAAEEKGIEKMTDNEIPQDYYGWWRIVETSQWVNDKIDILGPAMLSLTGYDDRLRMFVLLAHVNCMPTKTGVSFTWQGAWEYDPVTGTGSVSLRKDGRLAGKIRIKHGDESSFIAERAEEPDESIPEPPLYRDKWRSKW